MSLIADLKKLEERVQGLIEQSANLSSFDEFQNSYTNAILSALGEALDGDGLPGDYESIITSTLQDFAPNLSSEAATDIADNVIKMIKATVEFYEGLGVAAQSMQSLLSEAPQAEQIFNLLDEAILTMSEELREATLELAKDFAFDNKGRKAFAEELVRRTEAQLWKAKVNAKLVASSLNQISRNEFADRAQLQHFYYYGSLDSGSRPFCIAHIGKTYSREQIDQMSNGMLSPVFVFKGGYNCKHTWLPVDLEWDEELKNNFNPNRSASEEPLSEGSKKTITVLD